MNLNDDIKSIKGIGDKTAPLYNKLGLFTVDDIIHDFPRDYVFFDDLTDLSSNEMLDLVSFEGILKRKPIIKYSGKYCIVTAEIITKDSKVWATWFNMSFISKSLEINKKYVFRGFIENRGAKYYIDQPQVFTIEQYDLIKNSYQPVYSLTKGLTNNSVKKSIKYCLDELKLLDNPIYSIHFPKTKEELYNAREIFVYEEFLLFILSLRLLKESNIKQKSKFNIIEVAESKRVIENLSFRLTFAQEKVLKEIENDLFSNKVMTRLVQGDVGCGKTILALLACITVAANGYQCAVMAPTEILASQHFDSFNSLINKSNINLKILLLTGSMTKKEKKLAYDSIKNGDVKIIIGTHALIQEKVEYNNLALVVTDEQHRFGVHQRELLAEKSTDNSPHILVMSATPIPRSLAMILYGDMDVSIVNEVPAKRLPIKNCVVNLDYRNSAYKFMQQEINNGHQVYVICPLVEKSESLESTDVISYTERLRAIMPKEINVGCLHGKMKASDKQNIMDLFSKGHLDILVSTTVVEVGVNVPNATVMLIEDADRFGLAQLHQLRGRIGRGDAQSYCIFMSSSKNKKTMDRLAILNSSNDGFEIASKDLQLRGPGDIFGIRQSGDMRFRLGDIYTDANILKKASEDAENIIKNDPDLSKEENKELKYKLEKYKLNSSFFNSI